MSQRDRSLENSIRIPGLLSEFSVFLASLTPFPVSTIRALSDNSHRNLGNELHYTDRPPIHKTNEIIALGILELSKLALLYSILSNPINAEIAIYLLLGGATYAIGLLGSINKHSSDT